MNGWTLAAMFLGGFATRSLLTWVLYMAKVKPRLLTEPEVPMPMMPEAEA